MVAICSDCRRGDINDAVDITDFMPCPRCEGSGTLPNYWTTREGEILFIPDMGDDHIVNCIDMMQMNVGNFRLHYEMDYVHSLPTPRTELTQDALDHELRDMIKLSDLEWLRRYHETYKEMLAEAVKRSKCASR